MFNLRHSFPAQEKDEAIFVFARPYWIAFIPTFLIFTIVFLFAAGLQIFALNGALTSDPYISNAIILTLGVFQLLTLIVFLVAVLDFYYDILIVTDRRITDIDQEQLFYRKLSQLSLDDIEDVSVEDKGIFQSLFNYGNITIQTAGERPNFIINNIHYATDITSIISELSQQTKQNIPETQRFPQTDYVGFIEGVPYRTGAELAAVGAIPPGDPRGL